METVNANLAASDGIASDGPALLLPPVPEGVRLDPGSWLNGLEGIFYSLLERLPRTAHGWLLLWLLFINAAALFAYGLDKRRARQDGPRVPERRLFLLALLGGSPAALLAMELFRHKKDNPLFSVGVPVLLVVQLIFLLALSIRFSLFSLYNFLAPVPIIVD